MNTLQNADILCVALLRLNARSTAWINYIPSAQMCYLLCHIFMIWYNPNGIHHANFAHLHSHSLELWFCFEKFNSFSTNHFYIKWLNDTFTSWMSRNPKNNHAISWNAEHIQRISHFLCVSNRRFWSNLSKFLEEKNETEQTLCNECYHHRYAFQ